LPMAIVFMALVDAMITERVSVRGGLVLLPVLLAVGMGSVLQLETRRPVPLCTEEQQSTRLNTVEVLSGSVDGLPTDLNARKKGYLRSSGYGKKRSF
jgi:hypothetical protein